VLSRTAASLGKTRSSTDHGEERRVEMKKTLCQMKELLVVEQKTL
jgi:hypothetical protein